MRALALKALDTHHFAAAFRCGPEGSLQIPVEILRGSTRNIYMRRFVLAWKKLGLQRSPGSRIVTYADDLVILAAKSAQMMAAKEGASVRWCSAADPCDALESHPQHIMHDIYCMRPMLEHSLGAGSSLGQGVFDGYL